MEKENAKLLTSQVAGLEASPQTLSYLLSGLLSDLPRPSMTFSGESRAARRPDGSRHQAVPYVPQPRAQGVAARLELTRPAASTPRACQPHPREFDSRRCSRDAQLNERRKLAEKTRIESERRINHEKRVQRQAALDAISAAGFKSGTSDFRVRLVNSLRETNADKAADADRAMRTLASKLSIPPDDVLQK